MGYIDLPVFQFSFFSLNQSLHKKMTSLLSSRSLALLVLVVLQCVTAQDSAAKGVMMLPEIVVGLLLGLMFLMFACIGVCCVLSIQTPDIHHSTTLPIGKEY